MSDREERLRLLILESNAIVDDCIQRYVTDDGRKLAGVGILYSGGNDSTTLAHMFRHRADFAVHANTTIGIEQTRQFVRDTCAAWGLPLWEITAPIDYRTLVIEQGFPGPGQHFKMFQRLKERAIEEARRRAVRPHGGGHKARVVFLAGRRRDESQRRSAIGMVDRVGSRVIVSPLVNWTKEDLNTYRMVHPDVPRNEVSDLLHMSGECLCGAFAHRGELDEIGEWFPAVKVEIESLERVVAAAGHPAERCKWGWGAYRGDLKRSKVGIMCGNCELRGSPE